MVCGVRILVCGTELSISGLRKPTGLIINSLRLGIINLCNEYLDKCKFTIEQKRQNTINLYRGSAVNLLD